MKSVNRVVRESLAAIVVVTFLTSACTLAGEYTQPKKVTPNGLDGKDAVLTVESVTAADPSLYPSKGVIVRRYTEGVVETQTVGAGLNLPESAVHHQDYRYKLKRRNRVVERGYSALFGGQGYTLSYIFSRRDTGTWTQTFQDGSVLAGRFSVSESLAEAGDESILAPDVTAGYSAALAMHSGVSELPAGTHPTVAMVVQSYLGDGTYSAVGFGPGSVSHWGTYSYTRVSANVAVEEVIQNTEYFSLPYTLIYTFEDEVSGTWYQNFGDGLIIFSGEFTLFPSQ